MSTHTARIEWQAGSDDFLGNNYSRAHRWLFDGGAIVRASSSPLVVSVPLSDPEAVDPEEAFVAALSSCHMLWFLSLAAARGLNVLDYSDFAEGRMEFLSGRMRFACVTLRPQAVLAGDTPAGESVIRDIHEAAHERCYLANSVLCDVVCEPTF